MVVVWCVAMGLVQALDGVSPYLTVSMEAVVGSRSPEAFCLCAQGAILKK